MRLGTKTGAEQRAEFSTGQKVGKASGSSSETPQEFSNVIILSSSPRCVANNLLVGQVAEICCCFGSYSFTMYTVFGVSVFDAGC